MRGVVFRRTCPEVLLRFYPRTSPTRYAGSVGDTECGCSFSEPGMYKAGDKVGCIDHGWTRVRHCDVIVYPSALPQIW